MQGGLQAVHGLQQALEHEDGGEAQGCRVDVVGALAQVHVVIGVAERILAPPVAQQLQGAVGNDFVGVHVRGCARPSLHHVRGEVAVPVAVDDLLAGAIDGPGNGGFQQAQPGVGPGGALLHHGQGADHGGKVAGGRPCDGEVVDGPQGLDAEEGVLGHVQGTDQVGFSPGPAAGIGLLTARAGGGRVEDALVQHVGDLAEHRDGGGPILGQAAQHRLPVEVQQDGGAEGHGRGRVGAGGQEGLLARHIAGAQDHHGFGPVPIVPGDLHAALGDDRGAQPSLPLPEEGGPGRDFSAKGRLGDQAQVPIGQPGEDLAGSED